MFIYKLKINNMTKSNVPFDKLAKLLEQGLLAITILARDDEYT